MDWTQHPVYPPSPHLTLKMDASLIRWGTTTNGGGLWSTTEQESHINHLELLGGALHLPRTAYQTAGR